MFKSFRRTTDDEKWLVLEEGDVLAGVTSHGVV
jgi:hypothetical protein